MIRFFAKTTIDGKVQKHIKYEIDEDFEIGNFEEYVKSICEKFDCPTPVVLAKHIRDYILFGNCTFFVDDFIEKVYFERLIIESFAEC